jgi:hypothetical protein
MLPSLLVGFRFGHGTSFLTDRQWFILSIPTLSVL